MSKDLKAGLKRLERLQQIRQIAVLAAEERVKEAGLHVRELEDSLQAAKGNIRSSREEISQRKSATGMVIQNDEKFIRSLEILRDQIQQSFVIARDKLDERRREWTEALRERKVVEKIRERRLRQVVREEAVTEQKAADDISAGRYVRNT